MEHGPRTPERLEEQPRPVFDLERMDTELITRLAAIIDTAALVEDKPDAETIEIDVIMSLLGRELTALPERDLEKAKEVYFALANHESVGARCDVASRFGELFQRLPADDYFTRQQMIDTWVKLLSDDDGIVRGLAGDAMSDAVYSDWLDEPTARYLDSKLPDLWQREDWH